MTSVFWISDMTDPLLCMWKQNDHSMGDIAADGPPGKGLGMGQDVAIFRSRTSPLDRICCIDGSGITKLCSAPRMRHFHLFATAARGCYIAATQSGCALARSFRQEPA